jgi:hypothetical protein
MHFLTRPACPRRNASKCTLPLPLRAGHWARRSCADPRAGDRGRAQRPPRPRPQNRRRRWRKVRLNYGASSRPNARAAPRVLRAPRRSRQSTRVPAIRQEAASQMGACVGQDEHPRRNGCRLRLPRRLGGVDRRERRPKGSRLGRRAPWAAVESSQHPVLAEASHERDSGLPGIIAAG